MKSTYCPYYTRLARPTFFTRDLGFFVRDRCHDSYCLVCLDVTQNDAARYVRRFLRHPSFDTNAKRMGTVIRAGPAGLTMWRLNARDMEHIGWRR